MTPIDFAVIIAMVIGGYFLGYADGKLTAQEIQDFEREVADGGTVDHT
jgi:hypothetical protein